MQYSGARNRVQHTCTIYDYVALRNRIESILITIAAHRKAAERPRVRRLLLANHHY